MNYFAHGRAFVDQPYFLVGTAVPDWLGVLDRRMRVRGRRAEEFVDAEDPREAALARGILRHLEDDRWFHQTRAFTELNLEFTVEIRDLCDDDPGLRPSFLGHILVELLLDAHLIALDISRLDAYYAAVASIDPGRVQVAVNRMATRPSEYVERLIARFCSERFLYDYLQDEKLLARINRVLRRVGLTESPARMVDLLPSARRRVSERSVELLCPPGEAAGPT